MQQIKIILLIINMAGRICIKDGLAVVFGKRETINVGKSTFYPPDVSTY